MTALEERLARRMKEEPIRILYSDERIQLTQRGHLVIQVSKFRPADMVPIMFKRSKKTSPVKPEPEPDEKLEIRPTTSQDVPAYCPKCLPKQHLLNYQGYCPVCGKNLFLDA
jgi:hypothetical protein